MCSGPGEVMSVTATGRIDSIVALGGASLG